MSVTVPGAGAELWVLRVLLKFPEKSWHHARSHLYSSRQPYQVPKSKLHTKSPNKKQSSKGHHGLGFRVSSCLEEASGLPFVQSPKGSEDMRLLCIM